ncbi:hypothetical protein HWV62_1019 [Athelia sp. TMB]|nr:hypothetical protein HWV62_1019 [Athelia sp. TMB]
MSLSQSLSTVFGPPLSPDATYQQRQECRQSRGIPGRVDRWLVQNTRTTHIAFLRDYLMLNDVNGASCVQCTVELVRTQVPNNQENFAQPDVFTLYITASAPPRTQSGQRARTSPRAILERFSGSPAALDAPDWVQWENPILQFQQPRASFAALFTQMAFWEVNRSQPELALAMVQWAERVTIPNPSLIRKLQPQTPPSTSPPHHHNRRLRRPRPSDDLGEDQPTPTRPRHSI